MELLGTLLLMMGRVLLNIFTAPHLLLLYLLLFLLVAWQYRRLQNVSESLLLKPRGDYLKSAVFSTLLGVLGGILGSLLLVLVGTDLSDIGITYLWITALALMFIQPRFLCFAYAAGVLAISNLLWGFPSISIPQLMGLVAILHMVESFLILLNGPINPLPVYIKKSGRLRGGFNIQLFWPIPLVALMSLGLADPGYAGLEMPVWWPLLQDYSGFSDSKAFAMLPVLAILGYGEITTTQSARQASRKSALLLFQFSLVLLLLAILSARSAYFLPLAAIFSPLGHELVIWLGMRNENRRGLYVQPPSGIMVLDVLPGSPAERAGLKSRDIILNINGQPLDGFAAWQEHLKAGRSELLLKMQRNGRMVDALIKVSGNSHPGIIPVPDESAGKFLVVEDDYIFSLARRLWRRMLEGKF